jgi:hypothetical protein
VEVPKLDFRSASSAQGGNTSTPWYQGDFVTSFAGDARSGDRTAPGAGSAAGAVGASLSLPLLIGAAIIFGALLWRRSR